MSEILAYSTKSLAVRLRRFERLKPRQKPPANSSSATHAKSTAWRLYYYVLEW